MKEKKSTGPPFLPRAQSDDDVLPVEELSHSGRAEAGETPVSVHVFKNISLVPFFEHF